MWKRIEMKEINKNARTEKE